MGIRGGNAVDLSLILVSIILGSEDSSSPDPCEAKASLPKSTALGGITVQIVKPITNMNEITRSSVGANLFAQCG